MERIGVLSARPDHATGLRRLLLPSDEFVLVDDDASDDEIIARYDLDELRQTPDIRVCEAVYLDGPLEGQTNPYAPVKLGAHARHDSHAYELVALPDGDEPGKLRYISSRARSSS
ncbi:hypothetical protein AB0E59_47675 [Lentzea sp. NPDC034063]|uniref:hypothetical protein n=1 Tax=unclassified Lentzea TaxID=2643253 RepID=UPI0033BFE63B